MKVTMLSGEKVLELPSARIARSSARHFRDATELFEEARAVRDSSADDARRAREEGYAAGRAAALDEMREALAAAIDTLQAGMAEEGRRREKLATGAAMQAVELLIGYRDEPDVAAGMVRQALAQAGATGLEVFVSPDIADRVAQEIDATGAANEGSATRITADPSLAPLQCRISTGDGRIIADLDTQLAALRQRWGLTAGSQGDDG